MTTTLETPAADIAKLQLALSTAERHAAKIDGDRKVAEQRVLELQEKAGDTNIVIRMEARAALPKAELALESLTLDAMKTDAITDGAREAVKEATVRAKLARLRKVHSRMLPKLLALQADADEQDLLVNEILGTGGPYAVDPTITWPLLMTAKPQAATGETWGDDNLPVWNLGARDTQSFLDVWIAALRQASLLDE